jgi:hypothetical protein
LWVLLFFGALKAKFSASNTLCHLRNLYTYLT